MQNQPPALIVKLGWNICPKNLGAYFFTAIGTWLFGSYSMAVDYVYICSKCGLEMASLPPLANEIVVKTENNELKV